MEIFEAELMKECEALHDRVNEDFGDGDDCLDFPLPIAKIDGIAVEKPRISFYRAMALMIITIDGEVLFADKIVRYKKASEFTLELVQTFMLSVASTLRLLRFDAFTTTFVERPRKRKCWELFQCDSVQMEHGPCAGQCGETTLRTTMCHHHLCLRCEQRLKTNTGAPPCPVCRAPLDFLSDQDSDDE